MNDKIQIKHSGTRPPIVVVMGHIDHGKTKILDYFRKTRIVESESGGITQHIGAYEVEHQGKKITFIDTPGHEAFSKLRSRGAKVADIAILVIAADEGIKPQTEEALEIIRQNNLPFIVAINKIDKPEANPERVRSELAERNVIVESYGGKVPAVEISAKEGQNLDLLLEMILLVAELENLQADPSKPAEGTVIEVHPDPQRGPSATLMVLDGTLKIGDFVAIGRSVETVKIMENFLGRAIESAGPSSPALVAGLKILPLAGDRFYAFLSKEKAEEFVTSLPPEAPKAVATPTTSVLERPAFNLVVKTDVAGSREALEEALKKLESDSIGVNIIKSEVGDINETDIKFAMATKLVTVVGFKVGVEPAVRELAEQSGVRVVTGDVIYELLDKVKGKMEEMLPPEIRRKNLGRVKILKIFSARGGKKDGSRQILGGRVEEGLIKRGVEFEIKRLKESAGSGKILQLQQNKQNTDEVPKGLEFGAMTESKTEVKEGDILEIYEEEIIQKKL